MASSSSSSQNSNSFHWHYADFDDNEFQIHGRTLFFIVVLFAVVLIVTLLFLYSHWICKYRSPSIANPASSAHAPPVTPPPQGLDPAFIDSLPVSLHRSRGNDSSGVSVVHECCICLGVFEDGDKVKVLPGCNHCFHSECVDKWLRSQSSCPLCRASLRFDLELAV